MHDPSQLMYAAPCPPRRSRVEEKVGRELDAQEGEDGLDSSSSSSR